MKDEQTMSGTGGSKITDQYVGSLTDIAAANAIRSARLNALELLDTADLLFSLKRFPHSVAVSILAMEEAAKVGIILMIYLEIGGNQNTLWKSYRSHRAKTSWLNPAIESRIRASFPQISREKAKQIGNSGPGPDQLETTKQRALYSDCLEVAGDFVAHCPNLAEWRKDAWERLCEAKAVVSALRDHPPAELQVWRKHVFEATAKRKNLHSCLPKLHEELLEKGFVKEGWWDTLLKDAEFEAQRSE
ncbi:MAG: AbiV family abortive infection protein [Acidobacteriaceae bacterium]